MSAPVHEDVFQEPDRLPRTLLLRIAVGTLALGLSLCVVAYLLLRAREYTLRPSSRYPEAELPPPHRVAEVRQEVFQLPFPKATPLEQQSQKLEHYGWVDRGRGIVHVPVEVGIDLVLEKGRKERPRP